MIKKSLTFVEYAHHKTNVRGVFKHQCWRSFTKIINT